MQNNFPPPIARLIQWVLGRGGTAKSLNEAVMRARLEELLYRTIVDADISLSDFPTYTQYIVTSDGHRADFVIELPYRIYVFDFRRGSQKRGSLGIELMPSSILLNEKIRSKFSKSVELVYVSPSGASSDLIARLKQHVPGVQVFASDSRELKAYLGAVCDNLKHALNPDHEGFAKLSKLLAATNLTVLQQDIAWYSFIQGYHPNEIAKQITPPITENEVKGELKKIRAMLSQHGK